MKPQVVILAAGESSRFYPFNQNHKAWHVLAGKPILAYTLESIHNTGIQDVIIVHSGLAANRESLSKFIPEGMNVEFITQSEPLGQGHAILLAKDHINRAFYVINANHVLFEQETLGWESRMSENVLGIALKDQTDSPWDYGMLRLEGDKILEVVEKPAKGTEPSNWKVSVVYLFQKRFIDFLEKQPLTHYSLEAAVTQAAQTQTLLAISSQSCSPSLKYPWHLFKLRDILFKPTSTLISESAKIAPTAIIRGDVVIEAGVEVHDYAIVEGPAYLGKNALVGQFCLIRNGSILEEGVHIERYCDVRNSLIGSETHIHSQFIGDSIIGNHVRIGAGFITANKRHDREDIKVLVKGEKVSCNQNNLGVLIGNNVKIGVKTATMPGTVIGSNSVVNPGIVLKGYWETDMLITKSNT